MAKKTTPGDAAETTSAPAVLNSHREQVPEIYVTLAKLGKAESCRRFLPAWSYADPHSLTEEQIAKLLAEHNKELDERKWPKTRGQLAAQPPSTDMETDSAAPVQAAAGTVGVVPEPVHASRLSLIPEGAADSDIGDIQYMPPGKHSIVATRAGEPVELDVVVDAGGATALNTQLQDRLRIYSAGHGPEPFFDFGHRDEDASAHPLEIYWGGEDPVTGGIRAKARWTVPGKAAVQGRSYRKFSPSFIPTDAGGVGGAPLNMGGLVNRPAFSKISDVKAQQGNNPKTTNMNELLEALLKAGFITTTSLTPAQVVSEIKAAQAVKDDAIKAKDTELGTMRETNAKAIVAKAVAEGRLPAADTAVHAKWTETITRDPSMESLLASAPAAHQVPGTVTPGRGAAVNGAATVKLVGRAEISAKANAIAAEKGITVAKAMEQMLTAGTIDYDAYRATVKDKESQG